MVVINKLYMNLKVFFTFTLYTNVIKPVKQFKQRELTITSRGFLCYGIYIF